MSKALLVRSCLLKNVHYGAVQYANFLSSFGEKIEIRNHQRDVFCSSDPLHKRSNEFFFWYQLHSEVSEEFCAQV